MNLKLHEVIALYHELNGVTKQGETTEVLSHGMLKQKMSLKTKNPKLVNKPLPLAQNNSQASI